AAGQPPIRADRAGAALTPRVIETLGQRHELSIGTTFAHSPEWLSALRVPMLAGRVLTAADATVAPTPAVVTASLARTLWPEAGAVGQLFPVSGGRRGCHQFVVCRL